MQIVIDKENLITMFTVALYVVSGSSGYDDAKNAATELLEKVGYTPLEESKTGHGENGKCSKELTVFLPEVYACTEAEMNLKVRLKDGVVQDVTYISMNGCCEEGLEYAAESEGNCGAKMEKSK